MIKGSKSIETFVERFLDKLSDLSPQQKRDYFGLRIDKYEARGDLFRKQDKLDSARASGRLASVLSECLIEVTKREIEQLEAKRGMIAQQRSLISKIIH